MRAAAAAYGNAGEKNGVHMGFENLRGRRIKGGVDAVSNSKVRLKLLTAG